MSVVDDVKAKIDIVDLISAEVTLRRSGSTYKAPCPFHAEKTPSFIVNPDRQTWHCFGACSEGGDIFRWEMKRHNVEFREALRRLASQAGIELRPRTAQQVQQDERRQRLLRANDAALHFWRRQLDDPASGQAAQAYLRDRGISSEAAERFNLGLAPTDPDALLRHLTAQGHRADDAVAAGLILSTEHGMRDRFRTRLMFPIRNAQGETVGFGGRTLIGDPAKYVNTPESELFRKRDLLYGLDLARSAIRQADSVIIVEGYTDVISAHLHGSPNTVASMGTALTDTQVGLIKPLTTNIRLALDADTAGRAAARRGIDTAREALGTDVQVSTDFRRVGSLQRQLSNDIRIIILPPGRDPDDLIRTDPTQWRRLIEQAPTFLDWLLDYARELYDLDTPRGRQDFVEYVMPTIATIGEAVIRQEYLHRVAAWARVQPDVLLRYATPASSPSRKQFDRPIRTAPTKRDRQQSFILALALHYEAARDAIQYSDLEVLDNAEDHAILTARLNSSSSDWAEHIPEASARITQLERDASLLPPYSDNDAREALRDAVSRIRRNRQQEGLRLQNLEVSQHEREFGVNELAVAAAHRGDVPSHDPELSEAVAAVVHASDAARHLHQFASKRPVDNPA